MTDNEVVLTITIRRGKKDGKDGFNIVADADGISKHEAAHLMNELAIEWHQGCEES